MVSFNVTSGHACLRKTGLYVYRSCPKAFQYSIRRELQRDATQYSRVVLEKSKLQEETGEDTTREIKSCVEVVKECIIVTTYAYAPT